MKEIIFNYEVILKDGYSVEWSKHGGVACIYDNENHSVGAWTFDEFQKMIADKYDEETPRDFFKDWQKIEE